MIVIGSYANTIPSNGAEKPLETLEAFLNQFFSNKVGLHILPIHPNSGDSGFSVDDWFSVDPNLGDWSNIISLANDRRIILDVIYNHIGIKHRLYKRFLENPYKYQDVIFSFPSDESVRSPISPRGQPMLVNEQIDGEPWKVWHTFNDTAVDLNLENITVRSLIDAHLDFLKKLGVFGVRMDAPAYFGKEPGDIARHTSSAYKIVEEITDEISSRELDIIAQLDCDEPAIRYFEHRPDLNACIVDFSFSSILIHSILSGDPKNLHAHLVSTSKINQRILRTPRTHDGVLMRSGFQSQELVDSLCKLALDVGVNARVINEQPYELNSSLPFIFSEGVDVETYWRRAKLVVLVTYMTSDICYFYLPFILGFQPEKYHGFENDPRLLNRMPVTLKHLDNIVDATQFQELSQLINRLAEDRKLEKTERMNRNLAASVVDAKILLLKNELLQRQLVVNFGQEAIRIDSKGVVLCSSGFENGMLKGLGYILTRI